MAGVLDTSRFKFHLAEELGFSVEDVSSSVLGGHGDDMVALLRHTTVSGIPLEDMIKMKRITRQKVNAIVKPIDTVGKLFVEVILDSGLIKKSYPKYERGSSKNFPCGGLTKFFPPVYP